MIDSSQNYQDKLAALPPRQQALVNARAYHVPILRCRQLIHDAQAQEAAGEQDGWA